MKDSINYQIIYVRLLGEGTDVTRPVKAKQIQHDHFMILQNNDYDQEDEKWEFEPGEVVLVEEKKSGDRFVLVATKSIKY